LNLKIEEIRATWMSNPATDTFSQFQLSETGEGGVAVEELAEEGYSADMSSEEPSHATADPFEMPEMREYIDKFMYSLTQEPKPTFTPIRYWVPTSSSIEDGKSKLAARYLADNYKPVADAEEDTEGGDIVKTAAKPPSSQPAARPGTLVPFPRPQAGPKRPAPRRPRRPRGPRRGPVIARERCVDDPPELKLPSPVLGRKRRLFVMIAGGREEEVTDDDEDGADVKRQNCRASTPHPQHRSIFSSSLYGSRSAPISPLPTVFEL
jgi:hypothetical protein